MRIGIIPGGRGETYGLNVLLQQVVQAEEDGFDSFWFAHVPAAGFDSLTMVSLAGSLTSHIELGTAVMPAFPYHPLASAQQALTAQTAAGGRLVLALGSGIRPMVEGMMGLSYESPAARLREYLSVVRTLVNEGRVDFTGEFYKVKAELHVPDSSPFPVLSHAVLPLMLRVAGEVSDGVITYMAGIKAVETYIIPRVNAYAEAAGRPRPRVCVGLPIAVADDMAQAREAAARHFHYQAQNSRTRRLLEIEGVAGIEDVVMVGNEAEVERQLRAFADAGATDFLGAIFPVGEEIPLQESRAWALLKSLVGKI